MERGSGSLNVSLSKEEMIIPISVFIFSPFCILPVANLLGIILLSVSVLLSGVGFGDVASCLSNMAASQPLWSFQNRASSERGGREDLTSDPLLWTERGMGVGEPRQGPSCSPGQSQGRLPGGGGI